MEKKVQKKVYIYPYSGRDEFGIFNPYVNDVVKSFGKQFTFVNTGSPSKSGIFDLIKYLNKIDFVFLHWAEKLPEMQLGKLQSAFLILMFPILRLRKIKVVWTMHNKLAHSHVGLFYKKLLFKQLVKNTDFIITHSSEGIKYGEKLVPGSSRKIVYLPHPVKNRMSDLETEKKYDILIWGMISPYKGIHNFLEFLKEKNLTAKYKILIVGRVPDENYNSKLLSYTSDNIELRNQFLEDDELKALISQSKLVLFTYSKSSILSSGVLMDSLGYGAKILAPHVGAFADLQKINIVNTYTDFNDLPDLLDKKLKETNGTYGSVLKEFVEKNSWDQFTTNVIDKLPQ